LAPSNEAFDSNPESSPAAFDQSQADRFDDLQADIDSPSPTAAGDALPHGLDEAPAVTQFAGDPAPLDDTNHEASAMPLPALPPKSAKTHRFRKPALIGVAALVCALTVGGGTVAALTKTVTISVDGKTQQVTTLAGSVDGALAAAGLRVASHDALAPAGAVEISDGSQISLNRGRLFTVTIDGKKQSVWTTARTVDEALAEIGRRADDFQLSANRSRAIPLDGLQVTAASLHTVSVSGSHVKTATVTSPARTVADLLKQQGVKLGVNDRVSPALSSVITDGIAVTIRTLPTVLIADGAGKAAAKTSDLKTVGDLLKAQHVKVGKDDVVSPALSTRLKQGLRITITRVGYKLVTKTLTVAQPAGQTVEDDSMDKGTTAVTQAGHAGAVQVTYRMKVVNGKAGVPQELGRKAVKAAVATITHVGTYEAPVVTQTPDPTPTTSTPTQEAPASTSTSQQTSAPSTKSASAGDTGSASYYDDSSHWSVNWDAIAHCESTNNWSINTGNGYYGGLQFDYTTWLGAGGGAYADRADHASKSEQIAIAEKVYAARGLEPWACGYAAGG
jgi:uncharacterized protein YabE (DUF348 family)